MNILFDGQGNVARADIAQTSGVAILDSATRAYIRRHWHSDAYARRSVTVPVEYTLQQM
jgi:outer membrane biosynthesis protein TonB